MFPRLQDSEPSRAPFASWRGETNMPGLLYGAVVVAIAVYIYFILNDRKLSQLPPDAKVFSPNRFTTQGVLAAFRQQQDKPVDIWKASASKDWSTVHYCRWGGSPLRVRFTSVMLKITNRQAIWGDGSFSSSCRGGNIPNGFESLTSDYPHDRICVQERRRASHFSMLTFPTRQPSQKLSGNHGPRRSSLTIPTKEK